MPAMPTCSQCGRTFRSDYALRSHCNTKQDHHYCQICNSLFSSASLLRAHFVQQSNHGMHYCADCNRLISFNAVGGVCAYLSTIFTLHHILTSVYYSASCLSPPSSSSNISTQYICTYEYIFCIQCTVYPFCSRISYDTSPAVTDFQSVGILHHGLTIVS